MSKVGLRSRFAGSGESRYSRGRSSQGSGCGDIYNEAYEVDCQWCGKPVKYKRVEWWKAHSRTWKISIQKADRGDNDYYREWMICEDCGKAILALKDRIGDRITIEREEKG